MFGGIGIGCGEGEVGMVVWDDGDGVRMEVDAAGRVGVWISVADEKPGRDSFDEERVAVMV